MRRKLALNMKKMMKMLIIPKMRTSGGLGPDPRASKGLKIGLLNRMVLIMTEEILEKEEEVEKEITARKEILTHRGREVAASTVKKKIEEEITDDPMKLLILYLKKQEMM